MEDEKNKGKAELINSITRSIEVTELHRGVVYKAREEWFKKLDQLIKSIDV